MTKKEERLEYIHERYEYLTNCWDKSRKERAEDLRFSIGKPFTKEEEDERTDAGMHSMNHDQLRQYINQAINSVRQNKRGINVEPESGDADDDTATFRQDVTRTIEYNSQAHNIYITAYENALRGGYGFYRVGRRYRKRSFDQEIIVRNIANPDTVTYDWDCTEADWSDAKECFVETTLHEEIFKLKYPNAEIKSFSPEIKAKYPGWFSDKLVTVAEYWSLKPKLVNISELTYQYGTVVKLTSELTAQDRKFVTNSRDEETYVLTQEIMNAVEIIKKTEQPGELLPIIPVIGEEIWIDQGLGAERLLLSLIRLARDPQKSLAYLVSQMMGEASESPKAPLIGYVGQFETDKEAWDNAHKKRYSRLQVDPVVDKVTGQLLPLPTRNPFKPNFNLYAVAIELCSRGVQSAMGLTPLPTNMQKDNTKLSGIAQERLNQAMTVGSFHFSDNLDRAICFGGRVMDGWIGPTYNKKREMNLRQLDDTVKRVKVNDPTPGTDKKGNKIPVYMANRGEHSIRITSAPSHQSQLDEVQDFLKTLIPNLPQLVGDPVKISKLLSIIVKNEKMGVQGDQIAEILDPQSDENQQIPPQAIQMIQELRAKLQDLDAYAKQKDQDIQKLQQKIDAKVVDNQLKAQLEIQLEAMREKHDKEMAALQGMVNATQAEMDNIRQLQSGNGNMQS